jgi:cytochrome c oxidase cbb3-type subunit 3/ubiquinol-cytochrome c reductase cytochrome c subunit
VLSFDTLYGENCAGCHGKNGDNGPATNLRNPEYQAWVSDATLLDVTANGRRGSLMPAFVLGKGGPLTDQQIRVIVHGMRSRWNKGNGPAGANSPAYAATHAGDIAKGQGVYAAACARCHGPDAQHPGKSGSVLDGALLGLINEQTVRTTVVPGRPDIGQPDWRDDIRGRPLTDDEVTDVSAWVIAQRPHNPGQPYPDRQPASERPGEQHPKSERAPSLGDKQQ